MNFSKLMVALCLIAAGIFGSANLRAELPARVNNQRLDPALSQKLEQSAKSGLKNWKAPGLAVGIVKNGKLVWTGYFGYADLARKRPITQDSIFELASVSKTFTALGMMQQWEQGKFKMDDPVNSHAPYPIFRPCKKGCREVTFLDVFTHTSGGGELMSWRQLGDIIPSTLVFPGAPRPPLKEVFTDGIRPHVCAGTKYYYCNFCVGSMGLVLEQLSGESFADYQDAHILKPLGMTTSHFYETDAIRKNLARGYNLLGGLYTPIPFMRYPVTPMTGLYSNVNDMANYMIALLNHGRLGDAQIVKPETLEFMFTPHYSIDPRLEKIGITFFISENYFGHKIIAHDGATPGYGTQLLLAPQDNLGMIAFTNIMNQSAYQIAAGMFKMALEHHERPAPAAQASELWPGFVGSYGSAEPDLLSDFRFFMDYLGVYRVVLDRGSLMFESMRPGTRYRLRQVDATDPYFYVVEKQGKKKKTDQEGRKNEIPKYVIFVPGKDGKVSAIRTGLNEYVRLEGEAKTKAYAKALMGELMPEIF